MAARVKYATSLAPGLLIMGLLMDCAHAQQQPQQPGPKRDDLDVTMQIIVDPDAKLPDEVVRRIPLPERKPADQSAPKSTLGADDKSTAAENKERASEAKELGRELAQGAKEKAQEAAERREEARRAAEERERDRERDPPGPPDNPGRPPRS